MEAIRNQVQVAIFVATLRADDACLGAAPSLWRSDRFNIFIHQLESRNCRDCKDQGIVSHKYQQFFHFWKSICGLRSSPHKESEQAHNPRLQACMQIWVHVPTFSATSAKWTVFLPVLLISYPDMHIDSMQKSWTSMSCKYSMQHICALKDLWAGAKPHISCKWRHCYLCVQSPLHIYCTQALRILQFEVPSLGQLPFEMSRTYQNFNFKLTFRLFMANPKLKRQSI